ncbi:hypothetical protein [Niabella aurantiaca]|uniref:hypothetical protein n=1 Tax=Niabella aurantiaca TaxID=379900 RepID=UPI00036A6954|nr:hypothetical protein [Niabella aurantiaca]
MYQNQIPKAATRRIRCCLLAALVLTGCTKPSWQVADRSAARSSAGKTLSKGKDNPVIATGTVPLGTWWWSTSKRYQDQYLDFAHQNGITEIYFYTVDFSEATGAFIENAGSKGIKVFLLAGSYQWIHDRSGFISLMNRYTQYQHSVSSTRRFSGIHLDVEPQQDPEFRQQRAAILQQYIDFVVWACDQYAGTGTIDFDIPFWMDDEVMYKGEKRRLYEAVISTAARVFIMSYRDTAAGMYAVSKEELAFAASQNKQLFLGAETAASKEGDAVTYVEEGKAYLYGELQKLGTLCGNMNYGVSVHHIQSWYRLKK